MWFMNSKLEKLFSYGIQNRQDKGYIFPITLILSVLFSSFLLHQIENYRLEKLFYHEVKQQFDLDVMMKYTWDFIEGQLIDEQQDITSSLVFARGDAKVTTKNIGSAKEIIIVCTTSMGRVYRAIILYDLENKKVLEWHENI